MARPRKRLDRLTEEKAGPAPTRRTRVAETRAATSRAATRRPMPMPHYESELYIPPHIVPPGMSYSWVSISVLNEPDHRNWGRRSRAGWQPVPRDRHPEQWPLVKMPGMETNQYDHLIISGGLLLCEKPTHLVEQAQAKIRADRMDALRSIDWTQQGLGDTEFKGAPKINQSALGIEQVVAQPLPPDGEAVDALEGDFRQ